MLFDEAFIQSVSDEPISGIVKIIDLVRSHLDLDGQGWTQEDFDVLLEGYGLVLTVIENFGIEISINTLELSGELQNDTSQLNEFMVDIRKEFQVQASKLRLSYIKNHFSGTLGRAFAYEFSKGDLDRIQLLINELRDQIAKSPLIEADHKRRLIKRLETLQKELHKRMSDVDRFWGLVGDAGVVLGKLGKDAKPIVDRIREIADIVWRTQARSEELPSDSPTPLIETEKES